MKKVRVGVIGVGYLGRFHAEKYATIPGVELVGIVDVEPERASLVAKSLNTRQFSQPAQLLGLVDAVNIVVPTKHHYDVAKRFMEEGVHVFLEKPITVTLEQADELIAMAGNKGTVLQVGHIERFNPALTAVKSMLKAPRYMTSERAAPFTVRCTDVNVILDLMIHDLDIVADLAGSLPKQVSAAGAAVITGEIDLATARILFENGCIADVTASRISDEKKRLLRVLDGENVYTSDYQTQKATVSRKSGNGVPELVGTDISAERCDTLHKEICAFVNSIQTGRQPLVSGIEARSALALAQTISENIRNGTTAFVPISKS